MSLTSDIAAIKSIQDGVKNNKVTRFAYTQTAYTNNDVNGHDDYVVNRENNIPLADLSVIEVNQTVVDKGFRARASALNRMFLNHLFGRVSYNLNKINDLFNDLLVKIVANLGVANGIATLDASGRIPYSQLPEDAMEYQGDWNAQTNTPTLTDGSGTKGDTYNVTVGGTQTFGGVSVTFFAGDRIIYNGSIWQKASGGSVLTVAEIEPDETTGNVDISKQQDVYKLLPASFIDKVIGVLGGRVWKLVNSQVIYSYTAFAPCPVIAEHNGLWVVGGHFDQGGGYIKWSEDLINWTSIMRNGSSFVGDCYFVKYAGNYWFAGIANALYISANGKDYTSVLNVRAYDVCYANGLYVVTVDSNQYGYWSTDGTNWTQVSGVSNTGDSKSRCVIYANNLWLAGFGNCIYSSVDGKDWTLRYDFNFLIKTIVFANGYYVVGLESAVGRQSTDLTTWTSIGNPRDAVSIIYQNGMWLVAGTRGGMYKYNANFTGGNTQVLTGSMRTVAYYNGVFVAARMSIDSEIISMHWSLDGVNWSECTGAKDNGTYCVLGTNKAWVAVGASGIKISKAIDYLNGDA